MTGIADAITTLSEEHRSTVRMCHAQSKTAVFIDTDGKLTEEPPPTRTARWTEDRGGANSSGKPEMTIVIGANGAGKTTWTIAHRALLPVLFINPDLIAQGLGDHDDRGLQREASKIASRQFERALERGTTFGFESTFAGCSKPALVARAKEAGYSTRALFLATTTVELNIARVRRRKSEGGHWIPEAVIERRWEAAQENLTRTHALFDEVVIADTSSTETEIAVSTEEIRGKRCKARHEKTDREQSGHGEYIVLALYANETLLSSGRPKTLPQRIGADDDKAIAQWAKKAWRGWSEAGATHVIVYRVNPKRRTRKIELKRSR